MICRRWGYRFIGTLVLRTVLVAPVAGFVLHQLNDLLCLRLSEDLKSVEPTFVHVFKAMQAESKSKGKHSP
jgi:hypothetical protein